MRSAFSAYGIEHHGHAKRSGRTYDRTSGCSRTSSPGFSSICRDSSTSSSESAVSASRLKLAIFPGAVDASTIDWTMRRRTQDGRRTERQNILCFRHSASSSSDTLASADLKLRDVVFEYARRDRNDAGKICERAPLAGFI